MVSNRIEFNGSGSKVKVIAVGNCVAATTYNVYYVDPEAEATELVPLNGSTPTANPSQLLSNIPCGSGEGSYWVRPINPVTHMQQKASPIVLMTGTSCGGGGGENAYTTPGAPSMNAQFIHWDHLGSTRMVTDELGVSIAAFKYYPFGMEAESTGGDEIRQKFTGHERDDGVGLDYMMARSCRLNLGRFLEPDPFGGSMRPRLPQSWNRYAYVLNSPINSKDPLGYVEYNDAKHAATTYSDPDRAEPNQSDNSIPYAQTSSNGSNTKAEASAGLITGTVSGSAGSLTVSAFSGTGEVHQGSTTGSSIEGSVLKASGVLGSTGGLVQNESTLHGGVLSATGEGGASASSEKTGVGGKAELTAAIVQGSTTFSFNLPLTGTSLKLSVSVTLQGGVGASVGGNAGLFVGSSGVKADAGVKIGSPLFGAASIGVGVVPQSPTP